jgi:hypothetical protein
MCIIFTCGLNTGTGRLIPFSFVVPERAADRRWLEVVVPDVLEADVLAPEVLDPDVREVLDPGLPEVREPEVPDVRELDVRDPDAPDVALDVLDDVLEPDALEPDAREPDVVAEVLALDVPALDVLAPDARAPELLVPELCVRVAVPRDVVLVLVALPASAIPSHPPAHVPERVVRLSPRCFRERGLPCLAPQIQTDLFPGHGGAMGGVTGPRCPPPDRAARGRPDAAAPPSRPAA